MDRGGQPCWIARMRRWPFLFCLLVLPGCAYWRGEPEIVVAPDPVVYPAPAQLPRYLPWIGPRA
jgi:hypothetical protein